MYVWQFCNMLGAALNSSWFGTSRQVKVFIAYALQRFKRLGIGAPAWSVWKLVAFWFWVASR